jgi:hypothetical protein
MENTKELKKAVAVGLLAEFSIRRKLRQLKRGYGSARSRRELKKDILRHLKGRKRPHRLPPNWKDIAVDGWDSMVI